MTRIRTRKNKVAQHELTLIFEANVGRGSIVANRNCIPMHTATHLFVRNIALFRKIMVHNRLTNMTHIE